MFLNVKSTQQTKAGGEVRYLHWSRIGRGGGEGCRTSQKDKMPPQASGGIGGSRNIQKEVKINGVKRPATKEDE